MKSPVCEQRDAHLPLGRLTHINQLLLGAHTKGTILRKKSDIIYSSITREFRPHDDF